MPFSVAAEIGTEKVIKEHSTIAVMVTSDGTITDIDRSSYLKAEERVVSELKEAKKPFVIVLNSLNPYSEEAKKLESELRDKYLAPVVLCDVSKLSIDDINQIITNVLFEFPVKEIKFSLPKWVRTLPFENEFVMSIMDKVKESVSLVNKMSDHVKLAEMFSSDENVLTPELKLLSLADGTVYYDIPVSSKKFYDILSEECGVEIQDDSYLLSYMKHLTYAKQEYDKVKYALEQVNEKGYGVVTPKLCDMTLQEPQIIKKGGGSVVKLKAVAPTLHIMKLKLAQQLAHQNKAKILLTI